MKVALAGVGAFGIKHLNGIKNIDGVEVVALVGRTLEPTREKAREHGAEHAFTDLADALALPEVDAVILATPTQMHAEQSIQCMRAGKHVQVEIPLADTYADALEVDKVQKETGLVCMVGHTRRFNPSHQWVNQRLRGGELNIQQMDVQTYFFRRKNINAEGGAAIVDGSPAVAPRGTHCRPVPVPGGLEDRQSQWHRGPAPSGTRHCHGHVDTDEDRKRRDLHLIAVVQQRRTARHVLSATSAITVPTSRVMTISSMVARTRSTSRTSPCQ